MIIIYFKDAMVLWFCLSIGNLIFQLAINGRDALIIDMITPAYWMLAMVIFLRFNSIDK